MPFMRWCFLGGLIVTVGGALQMLAMRHLGVEAGRRCVSWRQWRIT